MFTSDKRLMLTEDNQVVKDGDPKAVKLLVAEGGTLSDEDAAKYGLSGDGKEADDPNRPKEINLGGEESPATAENFRDEEAINLGEADDHTTKAGKKASKKSARK